jgi:hypothetical protein
MIHFIYCFFFFLSKEPEKVFFPTRCKSTKKTGVKRGYDENISREEGNNRAERRAGRVAVGEKNITVFCCKHRDIL